MTTRPLRTRLTVWTVLVGGLSMALFGAIVGFTLKAVMLRQFDVTLRQEADSLMEALERLERPVKWSSQEQVAKVFSSVISLYSFEIEQPPGKPVFRMKSLGETGIPEGNDGTPYTAKIGDIEAARIVQITRNGTRLRVAVDLSPLQNWETSMWRTYSLILPATVLLLSIGGSWFYRKAMKPVDEIAAAADRITAERLDQRLPASGVRDEIGHLTEVLNRMINRLQQSFEQARRFSADASHELKTPLTILRGELESLLRSGQLPEVAEKSLLDLLDETGRLEHIVEGLLLLSQADSGTLHVGDDLVDLSALIEGLTDDIEILAERHGIAVEMKVAPTVLVKGSSQFLQQLVLNLCDNAIKYNRPGGTVRCELSTAQGTAVARVSNTGVSIPPEHREQIFDRFYRAESSRTRAVPESGQGLGLSICREIVRAHGGSLTIEPSEPGWNVFQFTLPLHAATIASTQDENGTLPTVAAQR
jgi:heavy metal sensor kinase